MLITRAATSPAPNVPTLPSTNVSLCSLVLAFVKAYRLKGENASLKQALHEKFSVPDISDALKLLWNHSRSELEALSFTYHERRGSEKNCLADLIIKDLLYAFDKLDSSDQIPPIFCEAADLNISFLPLSLTYLQQLSMNIIFVSRTCRPTLRSQTNK